MTKVTMIRAVTGDCSWTRQAGAVPAAGIPGRNRGASRRQVSRGRG
jgi:hypothetical protein